MISFNQGKLYRQPGFSPGDKIFSRPVYNAPILVPSKYTEILSNEPILLLDVLNTTHGELWLKIITAKGIVGWIFWGGAFRNLVNFTKSI